MNARLFRVLSLTSLFLLAAGCAAKNQEAVSSGTHDLVKNTPPPPAPKPAPAPAPADDEVDLASFGAIYYELDSAQLKPQSQELLQQVATQLRKRPGITLTISGHTCDLGTSEYNLALGEKRAHAAKDYLVKLGVETTRVRTVSYGEERPAQPGESEEARSQNRRSEFQLDTTHASLQR